LMDRYSSYENAWKDLDKSRKNFAELEEFLSFCHDLGYADHPRLLFNQLLKNTQCLHMTIEDLEAKDPIIHGNRSDENSHLFLKHSNTDNLDKHDLAQLNIAKRKDAEDKEKAMHMGAHDWKSLKHMLVHKYGTVTAAWRHGMDTNGNGKLSFMEFSKCCKAHSFEGHIKHCFQELDLDGNGVITFNEFDTVWYKHHEAFRDLLIAKFESYAKAWDMVDKNHNRMLEEDEFEMVCAEIGYTDKPKALFKQLLVDTGHHCLSPEDLEANDMLVTKAQYSMEHPMSPASTSPGGKTPGGRTPGLRSQKSMTTKSSESSSKVLSPSSKPFGV